MLLFIVVDFANCGAVGSCIAGAEVGASVHELAEARRMAVANASALYGRDLDRVVL